MKNIPNPFTPHLVKCMLKQAYCKGFNLALDTSAVNKYASAQELDYVIEDYASAEVDEVVKTFGEAWTQLESSREVIKFS